MKTALRFGFILFAFCGSAVAAADVKVVSDRSFQLAIVDSSRASIARDALHAAFAASLAHAMSASCGSEVTVKNKATNADQAAFGLSHNAYEAVLVIGKSLPRPLMISGVKRLRASVWLGGREKQVYLIFNDGDASLETYLSNSFADALGDPRFLDILDPDLSTEGAQLADSR